MIKKRRLWPVLLAAALGLIVLCSLGTWQMKRLAWKQGLIATLHERMAQEAIPLADALKRYQAGEDVEYLKVSAKGTFDPAHVQLKQTTFKGLAAWEGLAGFHAEDGQDVLVDLGAAPARDVAVKPVMEVTGIIRLHNLGRGTFDPTNNPAANEWYWWDVPALQQAAGLKAGTPPVILQAFENASGFTAAEAKVELRNNHLGYAITWYGLACALVGVTLAFVLRKADLQ
ncbi:SURF1 family protein [Aestuariivirga litoralis]|uniref:SURF1 family protein n=1 Tax=Aestuariivirga litoralis TaxID=2650924 RepID=UPI0018C65E28|nr:SURF1 family cytochrome oxidase biogenesis protein [Aestuariivirga litoralis]MBG1233418.1 hypothetical protein [Aestuariivirga litoralis]